MDKLITAVSLLLSSGLTWAANLDEAANAPVEMVSPIYVVLFLILFFGMIVGFCFWVWWNDKRHANDR